MILCECVQVIKWLLDSYMIVCVFICSNSQSISFVLHTHLRLESSMASGVVPYTILKASIYSCIPVTQAWHLLSATASSHFTKQVDLHSQEHIKLKGARLDCASKPQDHAYIFTGDYLPIIKQTCSFCRWWRGVLILQQVMVNRKLDGMRSIFFLQPDNSRL